MPYEQQINRSSPTAIIFLIDQSWSMDDAFGSNPEITKAEGLADAVNRCINELILRCTKSSEAPYHYFDIGLIGYSDEYIGPVWEGDLEGSTETLIPISEVADSPIMEERKKKVSDGVGGIIEVNEKFRVWVKPTLRNGTPMCKALDTVTSVVEKAVNRNPEAFPPTVIHVTDGESMDGDPVPYAKDLMSLGTADGNILLFNLHLSASANKPVRYPSETNELPSDDEFSKQLFEMSSLLPESFCEEAKGLEYKLDTGARGFVYNADLVTAIQMIQIGTRGQVSKIR